METVEYVWFHDESAMVILSLTTFEPGQPVCHCSEIVFYAPLTPEDPIILKQRPQLVLRVYRQDVCVDCNAATHCQCTQRRREAQGNTASSEHSINDTEHESTADHTVADRKDHTASALPLVAARWRRTFRTVFAGRRHGTLTLHAPASKSSPHMSFAYELLTRGGRALANRIQLHLLSRMPRTPPMPPPLALPAPPPPPHTLPLGALGGSAQAPALCGTTKPSYDCSAERMPDTSLARILNSGHEHQPASAHCASSPAFDASPDSTRVALTPALPSPLPLPTSEPLPKRPRTEAPRADTFLFSLDSSWSPAFPDDSARVPVAHSMTAAAAAAVPVTAGVFVGVREDAVAAGVSAGQLVQLVPAVPAHAAHRPAEPVRRGARAARRRGVVCARAVHGDDGARGGRAARGRAAARGARLQARVVAADGAVAQHHGAHARARAAVAAAARDDGDDGDDGGGRAVRAGRRAGVAQGREVRAVRADLRQARQQATAHSDGAQRAEEVPVRHLRQPVRAQGGPEPAQVPYPRVALVRVRQVRQELLAAGAAGPPHPRDAPAGQPAVGVQDLLPAAGAQVVAHAPRADGAPEDALRVPRVPQVLLAEVRRRAPRAPRARLHARRRRRVAAAALTPLTQHYNLVTF
ncbi:hypothetical protein FGB62_3g350 [Gracilaria domingensis]|nr:hypothetical protein FGB62_3g350 [Gracilaria domingensis]